MVLTVSYPCLHTFRGRVCSGASRAGSVVECADPYRARELAIQGVLGTRVQKIPDNLESPRHSETPWISRENFQAPIDATRTYRALRPYEDPHTGPSSWKENKEKSRHIVKGDSGLKAHFWPTCHSTE